MSNLDKEIQADLDRERERRTKSMRVWNGVAIVGALIFGREVVKSLLHFRGDIFYTAAVFVLMTACLSTINRRSWWK